MSQSTSPSNNDKGLGIMFDAFNFYTDWRKKQLLTLPPTERMVEMIQRWDPFGYADPSYEFMLNQRTVQDPIE